MKLKVGLISLGCPKNRVDSENMLGFIAEKHELVEDVSIADIIIINTCAFIESAKEESINTILEHLEFKKDNCKGVIVAGCMAERYAVELIAEIPEIDAVVGVNDWERILAVIDDIGQDMAAKGLIYRQDEHLALYSAAMPRTLTTPQHFAYIKIAEGCDNVCSYCVIPRIRGPYRSRKIEDIVEEVRNLAASGVREFVLIAQDTTYYGQDLYGQLMLPKLLEELNAINGVHWIRLMYLYPQSFTDELIQAMAKLPKVLHYIDIPLQHISDRILEEMNRRDTRASVSVLINKIRRAMPDVCIRTTFIVGFPGETEADFEELCSFVKAYRFDRVGVFTYSQEEDTLAAEMPEQIDEETKEYRKDSLMAIQAVISEEINRDLEERELEVVIEDFNEEGVALARSYREAPEEIDGCIYLENAEECMEGDFVQAIVSQGLTYEVFAERKLD